MQEHYTDPRMIDAAKPIKLVTIPVWIAADATLNVADLDAALNPLGIYVRTDPSDVARIEATR